MNPIISCDHLGQRIVGPSGFKFKQDPNKGNKEVAAFPHKNSLIVHDQISTLVSQKRQQNQGKSFL